MPITPREKWYVGIIISTAIIGSAMLAHAPKQTHVVVERIYVPFQPHWTERYQTLIAGLLAGAAGAAAIIAGRIAYRGAMDAAEKQADTAKADRESTERLARENIQRADRQHLTMAVSIVKQRLYRSQDITTELHKLLPSSINSVIDHENFLRRVPSIRNLTEELRSLFPSIPLDQNYHLFPITARQSNETFHVHTVNFIRNIDGLITLTESFDPYTMIPRTRQNKWSDQQILSAWPFKKDHFESMGMELHTNGISSAGPILLRLWMELHNEVLAINPDARATRPPPEAA